MSFQSVADFEKKLVSFFGSTYAVATDCCTHAIELCLRHTRAKKASCPLHTYISVPFTFEKLGIEWKFVDDKWSDYYHITENIIDAAVFWQENGYIENTFMCLSFQFKKHLSIGRGGVILLDNKEDYITLKKMSYDGRLPDIPWARQNISTIGYHYYMAPETAEIGLNKLPQAIENDAKIWTWQDYPNLTNMTVFQ